MICSDYFWRSYWPFLHGIFHQRVYTCNPSYLLNWNSAELWVLAYYHMKIYILLCQFDRAIFSSTFRRKKIQLLSLRRQCLGRLSFLSESISQKLSKVSIWNLEYLFTIKRWNQLQQGRWPCDLYIQSYLPLFWHST